MTLDEAIKALERVTIERDTWREIALKLAPQSRHMPPVVRQRPLCSVCNDTGRVGSRAEMCRCQKRMRG